VGEPIIIAALISLIAGEAGAIITLLRNGKKKDNPGTEIKILLALTEINTKLEQLDDIKGKLDDLLRR